MRYIFFLLLSITAFCFGAQTDEVIIVESTITEIQTDPVLEMKRVLQDSSNEELEKIINKPLSSGKLPFHETIEQLSDYDYGEILVEMLPDLLGIRASNRVVKKIINAATPAGETPLMIAARLNCVELAAWLRLYGADTTILNNENKTVFDLASARMIAFLHHSATDDEIFSSMRKFSNHLPNGRIAQLLDNMVSERVAADKIQRPIALQHLKYSKANDLKAREKEITTKQDDIVRAMLRGFRVYKKNGEITTALVKRRSAYSLYKKHKQKND